MQSHGELPCQRLAGTKHTLKQIIFRDVQSIAHLFGRLILQHPQLHHITQVFGQVGNALLYLTHRLALLCPLVGPWLRAYQGDAHFVFLVVICQAIGTAALANRVHNLVLQHRR